MARKTPGTLILSEKADLFLHTGPRIHIKTTRSPACLTIRHWVRAEEEIRSVFFRVCSASSPWDSPTTTVDIDETPGAEKPICSCPGSRRTAGIYIAVPQSNGSFVAAASRFPGGGRFCAG